MERNRPARILVVDDNPEILSLVVRGLQRRGYEVTACPDAASATRAWSRELPDLAVLDILLPDGDGVDLCFQLQSVAATPVIMLTSRDSVLDRVNGLRAGADDYVVKPFAMEELAARIEAVLRRKPAAPQVLDHDDLQVDIDQHRVTRAGREINLTAKEFQLLEMLARRPNRVFARPVLAEALWPDARQVDDNLLDAHVNNLRQKLEAHGGRRLVQTVRGVGFVLR